MRTLALVSAGSCILLLVACSGIIGTKPNVGGSGSNSPLNNGGLNPLAGNKEKIVGRWDQVLEGPAQNLVITLEFTADGKLKMTGPISMDGTYTVDGDKLTVITTMGKAETKNVSTIQTLNDTDLVTKADKGGQVSKYKRKR